MRRSRGQLGIVWRGKKPACPPRQFGSSTFFPPLFPRLSPPPLFLSFEPSLSLTLFLSHLPSLLCYPLSAPCVSPPPPPCFPPSYAPLPIISADREESRCTGTQHGSGSSSSLVAGRCWVQTVCSPCTAATASSGCCCSVRWPRLRCIDIIIQPSSCQGYVINTRDSGRLVPRTGFTDSHNLCRRFDTDWREVSVGRRGGGHCVICQ